jgi:hypothetical protein
LTQQYGEERARLPADDLASMRPMESDARKFVGNWQGRFFHVDIELGDGALQFRRDAQATEPVNFLSPEDIFLRLTQPANAALVLNYHPGKNGKTAWLDCWRGESILDYNDGPQDPPGGDRKEWDALVGEYTLVTWGKESGLVKVHRKNGYLYFGELRLVVELEPGLFFASTGEALDFRQTPATWRNVRLTRKA